MPVVTIERVATLDSMTLARCDFSFDPLGVAYPFDIAFAAHAAADRRMIALARADGQTLGYIACTRDGETAEVRRLEIDRAARGQGVARTLLAEARIWAGKQGLRALRLETMVDNPGAGRFFAHYGFTRCDFTGARAVDALHWRLPLGG